MATDAELIERYGLTPTDAAADDAALMQRYRLTPVGGAAPERTTEGTPTVLDVVQEQLEPLASAARTGAQNIGSTLQRGAAYLFPPESPARAAAVQQAGLPQQAGFVPEFAAEMVGESPTMAGTVLGGAFGAGLGPMGALAGAGMGAAAGSLYRHLMGLQASDQLTPAAAWQQAVPRAAQDTAWELGFAGAGPLVGRGVQAAAQRLRAPGAGAVARGLRGTQTFPDDAMARAAENYTLGRRLERQTGIPYGMTPGELTESPFLRDRERMMRLFPEAGEILQQSIRRRSQDAERIGMQFAEGLRPDRNFDASAAYERLPRAAKEIFDAKRVQRRELTTPIYNAVLDRAAPVDVKNLRRNLTNRQRNAPANVRAEIDNVLGRLTATADESGRVPARVLHELQMNASDAARRQDVTTREGAMMLAQVSKPVQNALKKSSPEYRQVTEYYHDLSEGLERYRDRTRLGRLGQTSDQSRLEEAGRGMLRETSSPGSIRNLRNDLKRELRGMYRQSGGASREFNDIWKGYQRAFFEDQISSIKPLQSGDAPNIPGQLRTKLGGAPDEPGGMRRRRQIDEVLMPRQRERLDLILQAMEKTSGLFSLGSPTAARQEAASFASDILTEGAVGGVPAVARIAVRAAPESMARFLSGGADLNKIHAEVIMQGLDASMDHLRRLNRELQRLRLADPITIESDAARLWGTVLGNVGGSAVEAVD